MKSVDVSRTVSAGGLVFDALRRAIVEGELKDGEPIRQDEIARLFNTSRIPVREAIARLEQLGLVKNHRFKGAVVVGLSLDEADELSDFRCLVEAHVVRLAVPQMSPDLIGEMRGICTELDQVSDPMLWGDLNRRFHATLNRACGLAFHLATLDNAMDRLDRYLRAQLMLTAGYARSNAEHHAIVEACAQGDAEGAAALTVAHIRSAHATLRQHLGRLASAQSAPAALRD